MARQLILYTVEWYGDKWNNNKKELEGSGRVLIFKIPSLHLILGTEENHENPQSALACLRAEIWIRDLSNTKHECWPVYHYVRLSLGINWLDKRLLASQ
jgi:hypothetical protein